MWTIPADCLIDADDERRKKGILDGVSRLDGGGGPLVGGLVVDLRAWEVVCVLALDSVRLGVERSGVRAFAVVVGVGDVVSLIGFSDEIEGEA